jgi:beta-galactosidase
MRLARSALLALACVSARAESSPRMRENLNQSWLFERQFNGSGALGSFDRDTSAAAIIEPRFRDAPQPSYDDSIWQQVNLPHTWNAHDVMDEIPGYWRGIGWYRKHFTLDAKFAGKRIFLDFEGVNLVSEFWLNGTYLGIHKSGYTSFEFDVTSNVHFGGAENVLNVKVDNLYHATIPPTVKTDYSFYGGIYRDVWLRITDPVLISSVYWTTPAVDSQKAALQLHALVKNTTNSSRQLSLLQEVIDPEQKVVASISRSVLAAAGAAVQIDQSTELANPQLWSPDTPNLYTIRSTLRDGAQTLDIVENPLGFRWFRFDPQKGFFLNGKRLQIQRLLAGASHGQNLRAPLGPREAK